jgi:hypothetical protein
MTTPRASRPLTLVPQARDDSRIRDRGDTVARQWDPEAQLVGTLMHLPVIQAATSKHPTFRGHCCGVALGWAPRSNGD